LIHDNGCIEFIELFWTHSSSLLSFNHPLHGIPLLLHFMYLFSDFS